MSEYSFPFSRQPLKALYLTYIVTTSLFIRIPFWCLKYSIPALRPARGWTFSRSFMISAINVFGVAMFDTCTFDAMRIDAQALEKASDENGFVWIEPIPEELIKDEIDEIAAINEVKPARLGGCWVGKRGADGKPGQKAEPGEKVLYHLHGGGYVVGDASVKGTSGYICKETLKSLPQLSRAFIVDYRLCQTTPLPPKNAFPAQLIDAVTGYNYLVNVLGFEPANIMVIGESAGGHLAIIFLRYILRCTPSLPPPGALVLLSPSADWGSWIKDPESSFVKHRRFDCVYASFKKDYVIRSLLGRLPLSDADTNPWISPASRHLEVTKGLYAGFPPTLMVSGGAEMTLDPMRWFRDMLEADIGSDKVTYYEYPGASHVFMMWWWHDPEKTAGYAKLAEWAALVFP